MTKPKRKAVKTAKARKPLVRKKAASKKKKPHHPKQIKLAKKPEAPEVIPQPRAVNPDAATDPVHAHGHRRLNLKNNTVARPLG